jgi:hypothetical protein
MADTSPATGPVHSPVLEKSRLHFLSPGGPSRCLPAVARQAFQLNLLPAYFVADGFDVVGSLPPHDHLFRH